MICLWPNPNPPPTVYKSQGYRLAVDHLEQRFYIENRDFTVHNDWVFFSYIKYDINSFLLEDFHVIKSENLSKLERALYGF